LRKDKKDKVMLTTKDCVTIKDYKSTDSDSPVGGVNYTRQWFEFAATDTVEPLTKKSKGFPLLKVDGAVWEGSSPKDSVSKTQSPELVAEALNYLVTEVVKVTQGKDEPDEVFSARQNEAAWIKLLAYASRGYDADVRNGIQAANRPQEVLGRDEAIEKMAKAFQATGLFTKDAAVKLATQNYEASQAVTVE
jgi:hypothetical protein